jgi:hypothetical protein
MRLDEADPKGLIREAYRIEGIAAAECRSILLDWALSLPPGTDYAAALRTVVAAHCGDPAHSPAHPMTLVLRAGLEGPAAPRRRGGRAARLRRG